MKKIILFFSLCMLFEVHAQNWDGISDISKYTKYSEKKYVTIKETPCYDGNFGSYGSVIKTVKAKTAFFSSQFAYTQDETSQPFWTFEYIIGYEDGWISTGDLILTDSDVFPDTIVTVNKNKYNRQWIPVWYNEILDSGKKLQEYSDNYKQHYIPFESRYLYINDPGYCEYDILHHIEFRNTFLQFMETYGGGDFSITNIKKNNNIYEISCELGKCYQSNFTNNWTKESFNNLPDLTENRETTFIIEPNGNRIHMYNGETKKLIVELMQADSTWVDSMIGYIKSDYTDKPSGLKPIEEKLDHPWSDPATGLCNEKNNAVRSKPAVVPTDSTTAPTTNVSVKKLMTTNCNLKLRAAEATTSNVLTVMSKNTKVKILELGKAETIDGISSNWVKVEVQKGAKDRDGKAIAPKTTGWCYGGYLE